MRVLPYINQDLDLIIENLKQVQRTEGNPAQPLRVRHNRNVPDGGRRAAGLEQFTGTYSRQQPWEHCRFIRTCD